eukprot:636316-Amphidinium_carterae.1
MKHNSYINSLDSVTPCFEWYYLFLANVGGGVCAPMSAKARAQHRSCVLAIRHTSLSPPEHTSQFPFFQFRAQNALEPLGAKLLFCGVISDSSSSD